MKKLMYRMATAVALFSCIFTLSACGSDDDNSTSVDSNIVGTWNEFQTSSELIVFGQTTLNSNGTFSSVVYNIYGENLVDEEGTTINEDNIEEVERIPLNGTINGNFTAKNGSLAIKMNGKSETGSYTITKSNLGNESVKQLTVNSSDGTKIYYMSIELQKQFKALEEAFINK